MDEKKTSDLTRVELERRRVGRYRFYQLWTAHISAGDRKHRGR